METIATRQDSVFYTHQLPNGLQLVGQLMPDMASAAALFWVRTGTRDENEKEVGVSHFLEHMSFRRTRNLSGKEIDEAFEELGADHNAGTWKEMTFYWARSLSENVSAVVQILADLTHPVLDAADFDQERNVILEEIARYEDQPSHVLLSNFMEDFFRSHPLSWDTLGTPESIKALTVDQMRDYWNRRYGTRNMIFAIAGNFDWDSIVQELETLTADWDAGEVGRNLSPAPFAPSLNVYHRDKFVQEQIAIGVPSVSAKDPRYYAAGVLATILGDDSGSRLFWALYHSGLADSATAQVMEFEDNGLLFVHIQTEPARTQEALEVAQNELRRLQEFDLQQDELDRAKAKLNSSVVIGGESTNERVMGLINSWLTVGKLETLDQIREKIEAVTLDDLRDVLEHFPVWPNQVITFVGPLPEDSLR